MVTLTKIGDEYNSQVLEITGLSTDEKPIGSIDGIAISNGSVFKEINTGSEYLYNAESNEWVKNTSSATSVSGKDGEDGVTPLLQKSSTAIQVSYDNGSTYEDLVPLSEITGEKGATGAKGSKGDTGATGATGADGKSAYQIWLDAGNTGDEATFISSLKGAKGDTGATGAKGDKGDTGATGSAGAKGDKGDKGDAFTYADFTSSQLAALKGEKGDIGATGAKGETGAKGDKGDTGAAGKNGASIASITLTKDEDGNITGGTATLTDDTTIDIAVV